MYFKKFASRMYTFKQNLSKEVCVAWWPEATIQRCKLRAAHFDKNAVREASDSEDSASEYSVCEYSSDESDYDLNRDGDLRTILLKSIKKQDKL